MGDALTVVAVFAALGFSIWATSLLAALIARDRAERARDRIAFAPGRTALTGAVGGFLWASFFFVLLSQPVPLLKIVGILGLGILGCVASVGLAGLALLVSDRIAALDPGFGPFMRVVRACTYLVLATITPLLGWFFIGPLILLVSLGAGIHALIARRHVSADPIVESTIGGR